MFSRLETVFSKSFGFAPKLPFSRTRERRALTVETSWLVALLVTFSVLSVSSVRAAAPPASASANTPRAQAAYTYYLPFLANSYVMSGTTGSYTTYLAIQNTGSATANIQLQYYQANPTGSYGGDGIPVNAPAGTCAIIYIHAECIAPNPFVAGVKGIGIITSDQPLNAIVTQSTPYGSTAYTATSQKSYTWFVPIASKNAFGGFSTQIVLANPNNSSGGLITISFYDQNQKQTYVQQNIFVPGHSTYTLDQSNSNLPDNFFGWAYISAKSSFQDTNLDIIVQVMQRNPNSHFLTVINGSTFDPPQPQPLFSNKIYVPTVFNKAFGSFVTGLNLITNSSQAVTVTITYYDKNGTAINTSPFVIPSMSGTTIYHGATTGNGIPLNGLPDNFYGSAVVTTQGGNVTVVVNELGGLTEGGMGQTGTYIAPITGSNVIYLPVMANGGYGFTTGATIFNISNQAVTATIQYYNLDGLAATNPQTFTIRPNSNLPFYQGNPTQGLPVGFKGTATVTETNGLSNSLIITANAQSHDFFYTYTQPIF